MDIEEFQYHNNLHKIFKTQNKHSKLNHEKNLLLFIKMLKQKGIIDMKELIKEIKNDIDESQNDVINEIDEKLNKLADKISKKL